MEHRYDTRFPTDHKTLVFKNGMPVAIGRIRNFSRGGFFIETDFDLIDINQVLEVELSMRACRESIDHAECRKCKAFVIHKAADGIGLLLREDCVETQSNFAGFIADELSRAQNAASAIPAATLASLAALQSTLAIAKRKPH